MAWTLAAVVAVGVPAWLVARNDGETVADARDGQADLNAAVEMLRGRVPQLQQAAAADPDSLDALFSGPDAPSKLGLVLQAVAENPTDPERDPLWDKIVQGISSLWNRETMDRGLDLMIATGHPRAQRAVIASFVLLARRDRLRMVTPEQRQTLTERFIDLHAEMPPGQQSEVVEALRGLGAGDVADALLGATADGRPLEVNRQYEAALEVGLEQASAETASEIEPPADPPEEVPESP